jgi:hypothetical protein
VISLDGHIEATRLHQRIPCSKGEEEYVVPSSLGVRREDESAGGAGRRRRSQAMWCGGGKVQLSVEMVGCCLLD